MGRRTARVTTAVAILLAAGALASPGCSTCTVECPGDDATHPVRESTGTVESIDGDLVRVSADDATVLDVHVFGRVDVLEVGETYVFPVTDDGSDPPTAQLPDPCDCGGPYISDVDGEVVDTAFVATLRRPSLAPLGFAAAGVALLVVGVRVLVRRRDQRAL